jgi:4-hydroxy-tetrahydrodipicolinate synthase
MKDLGILVPIVTPCTADGAPDLGGLAAVTRDMLDAGCESIFCSGSTGRGPWYGRDRRAEIARTVRETAGSETVLFAGCMAPGLEEMLANAAAVKEAGADIAVVTAPVYFNYLPEEIERIFLAFVEKSPLPVMIYDIPDFTGVKLAGGMVERLAEHENVVGFKDSSQDMARFRELTHTLESRGEFYLLQGKENLLAESMLEGASGFVVSLLHIDPRPFVNLRAACREGDRERAGQIQARLAELLDLVERCVTRRPGISTLFHILNHALRTRGVTENLLLPHEGETPDWVAKETETALALSEKAAAV